MWRGGQNKSRPVPALSETERLKMGSTYPINISHCSFAFILPIQFDVSYLSNYILIL